MRKIMAWLQKIFCAKLLEDNRQLRLIIENLPEYIYWKDINFVYQGCNWNIAKAENFDSPQDIIGKTDFDFSWAEERAKKLRANDQKIIAEGTSFIFEEEILFKQGYPRTLLTNKSPLFDDLGKIFGILGVSTDITELKNMQYKMQDKHQRVERNLRLVIENLPEYIYWKDCNFNYCGCNKNAAKYLNLSSPDEIIGKSDASFDWDYKRIQELRSIDKKVIEEGIDSVVEDVIPKPNGEQRIMLTSKSPLRDDAGNIFGILGVSVDITEKKELSEKLRELTIREERLRVLSAMGGMIAHELRTPLAAVSLSVSAIKDHFPILLQSYKEWSFEKKQSLIPSFRLKGLERVCNEISESLSQAENTIDMILNGFKPNQLSKEEIVLIDMDKLIDDFLINHPFTDNQRGLVDVIPNSGIQVLGSARVINYVLTNLVKNALYFINEVQRGKITIWTKKVDDQTTLHVKDTAKGIATKKLEEIFEPFYSSKSAGTSIGMGLYFCKMAIESMGGDIFCRSELGKYTEFVIVFPIKV